MSVGEVSREVKYVRDRAAEAVKIAIVIYQTGYFGAPSVTALAEIGAHLSTSAQL